MYKALGGENVTYLVHDDYYKGKVKAFLALFQWEISSFFVMPKTDLTHLSFEERAKTNFDHPDSLDTMLLVQHIKDLKEGKSVEVPTYDFSLHSRTTTTVTKEPRPIILVEGILLFTNPDLVEEMNLKIFVDADSDIRLSRRMTRDIAERGRTVNEVLEQYHTFVRPMHEEYVEPSKIEADLIVHSSGRSMEVATSVLTNHLRVEAGIAHCPGGGKR